MKPKRPNSIFRHIYEQPYHEVNKVKLYNSAKGSLDLVQRLGLLRKLPIHNGCVNCICWSDNGELLLSGSDDQRLVVSHAYTFKMLTDYKTSHRANIFSAKFLPCSGDNNIVSCSGDGIILFTDLNRPSDTHNNQFNCHTGTTYDVATVPGDPHTFLSCGEDYTVRCFDLRIKESCSKLDCQEDVLISCQRAVTALTLNSVAPHQLAIGCSDSTVRLFDRRMLGTRSSGFARPNCVRPVMSLTAPGLEGKSYRITSLAYSPEGDDVLVSYSSEHLYLFSCKDQNYLAMKRGAGDAEREEEDGDDGGQEVKTPSCGLPPIRRLRLRGDWSDTGPDARPEREPGRSGDVAQARPTLHATLMQRMTDVLSRMLNDPATRAALSHGGEDEAFAEHAEAANNPSARQAEQHPAGRRDLVIPPPPDELALLSLDIAGIGPGREDEQQQVRAGAALFLASPEVALLSDGEGSEGSSDMLWSEEPQNPQPPQQQQQQEQPPPPLPLPPPPPLQPLPQPAAAAEETVSLPSFESTYSLYTLVKSPSSAPPPPPPTALDPPPITIEEPSTSVTPTDRTSDSGPPDQQSLSCLTDQLSNMRHGFIEKHGTEPMVNLHYSEKGSTASRITMSVADEVNREHVSLTDEVASTSSAASSTSLNNNAGSDILEPFSPSNTTEPMTSTDVAGPSRLPPAAVTKPEPMSEEDESILNSDDEVDTSSSLPNKRLIHPIEKHMDSAIESARNSTTPPINPLCERTKMKQTPVKQKFTGHRNARTMIKEATFWGSDYVLSGSDCGHVFVWDRRTARLVMLLEADHHVVNCIQPHPHLPILATSGIDYDVKLWAPIHEEPVFDAEMAEELMKRNEVMLEETKDTITVPASFMIRMLACLNQIRRGGRTRIRRRDNNGGGSNNE